MSNKAEKLTRVKKEWLKGDDATNSTAHIVAPGTNLREQHNQHHFGVERTCYLAKKVDPTATKEVIKKTAYECERCQSINPARSVHESGELGVSRNWARLAIDVTHYKGLPNLTMVDCGPGRFAIWRAQRKSAALCICEELDQVFCERGPVEEVLMDHATTFRSREVADLLREWNVTPFFLAAYRPSGNGIVERHHRTIKTLSERGRILPPRAVFWYNMSPRNGQLDTTIPYKSVHCYE
ncbi:Pol polyprotein [Elysia marginata]|uniref:Pol polyprotein n=1 Tax=Elysia marginata TaxID=1093978 RepID=A0AAV4IUM2_9GAST|nr:Pol polyprotein [Elysia marginata]